MQLQKGLERNGDGAELIENAGTQFDAELVHVVVEKALGQVGEIFQKTGE